MGESAQLVALPGMGKSRLAKSLPGIYFDTNSLIDHDPTSALKILISACRIPGKSSDPTDMYLSLKRHLSDRKVTIILDTFNFLLAPQLKPFFTQLKSLRDSDKYNLTFLFTVQGAKPLPSSCREIVADLYDILAENIVYLPPLSSDGFHQQLLSRFSSDIGFIPTTNQSQEIYALSGGIPALIKITMQSLRDQVPLNTSSHPRLKAQLEEIVQALGSNPSPEILSRHGLLDSAGKIISRLLDDYLKTALNPSLSASETRLLNLFTSHPGQLLTKDDICSVVYPDVRNFQGITDHALDQLIHRLRKKISSQHTLVTRRGLGYELKLLS